MTRVLSAAALLCCIAATATGGLRWLRVAQREHYLAGSATRFAGRWWRSSPANVIVALAAGVGLVGSFWFRPAALITGVCCIVAPFGLSIRGRTSALAWTRRLKTVGVVAAGVAGIVVAIGSALGYGPEMAALIALGSCLIIDLALAILDPLERKASRRFVDQASLRLIRIAPTVVGITGSFGKTSTKNHLVGLIGPDRAVVPSPRSFNNRAGLALSINEHLADGTQVFIAEMGTYGPGEIAEMCSWCPPTIAVLTAFGPVHLERFGSLDTTVAAKAEIAASAACVVVNIDDERLSGLAERLALEGKKVVRVASVRRDADVVITAEATGWAIEIKGVKVGACPALIGVQPTNVACALAVALELGVNQDSAVARVGSLSNVENRLGVVHAPSGVVIIDDTFNSNPAGASVALAALRGIDVTGRRVVVTPGMIEMGARQAIENEEFARRAAMVADVVIVVGRTNRASLMRGLTGVSGLVVIEQATRDKAVDWVRASLRQGDAVLYENDLPDNYP